MAEETEKSVAYFCPECGSPSVEYSILSGSIATCKPCGWAGPREKLAAHQFKHESGTDDEILMSMLMDMRKVYAVAAPEFGAFLVKWGFFDGKNTKALSRYVSSMAMASFRALLLERQKMEEERVGGD